MPRKLTPQTTLDNLKKEAKRWLKDLRAQDEPARARFQRAHPQPPAQPTLRDVQLALAREFGFPGWTDLKQQLAAPPEPRADYAAWFLSQACPDWRTGGAAQQAAAQDAAVRILDRHPEIARSSIYTAVVCGDLAEVERLLAAHPQAASEAAGPKQDWQPLHYLCFTRLPRPQSNDHAVAIATALLDRGADPNAAFQIGVARHSPLVGVIGEGEEGRPPHPQAEALVRLLLDRGANPLDVQVLYNVGQGQQPCRWVETLYHHSIQIGREADWGDAAKAGLYQLSPLDWLLARAVSHNQVECAEWLLAHGAHPAPSQVEPSAEDAFIAACLNLDREAAQAILTDHPEFLTSHRPIFTAARQDRAEAVALLLDLGTPIEIENQQKQRPLHEAAGANAVEAAKLLIERGAQVDPRETNWNNTPLGFAAYGNLREMIDFLTPYSRDVHRLVSLGKVDRLREIFHQQPELATAQQNGAAPLWWIGGRRTLEVIDLLLAHGADPQERAADGTTVAGLLRRRGLEEEAHALEWRARISDAGPGHAERTASFLRMAAIDWRSGGVDRPRLTHSAGRLLRRHPEIARDSIYTAVVCGETDLVRRLLQEHPTLATEPGGPRGWPPLLYLVNARLPLPAASEHAVEIARALLDAGADPNVYYPGGDPSIHYSALTGVMGRGEEQAAIHPQAQALAGLLLERRAEPYDIQVMYNVFAGHASQRHLGDEAVWLLDLIHTHSIARGRQADWDNPDWPMLNMGGYGSGAYFLFSSAIAVDHVPLVEWMLAHGANPDAPPPPRRRGKGNLLDHALLFGRTRIAALLESHGATRAKLDLTGEEAFIAACLRLDRAEVQALLSQRPEFLQSPRPMHTAVQTGRADVVEFLLSLGVSPDIEDPKSGQVRPLHWAAYNDHPDVVQLLLDRGAEVDFFETMHDGTALWWALWGQKPRTVELLSRVSRDVWSLTVAGKVDRLREVLTREPRLAKVTYQNLTPLFSLPDEEQAAAEIVDLFLLHGADPALKNGEGETAFDRATARGLEAAARKLRR